MFELIILGGCNDKNGDLNNYTKDRIDFCLNYININNLSNLKIHFSGGLNERFNPTNISHSQLCFNYFFSKFNLPNHNINFEFHNLNNNTVEEAINIGNFLKNTKSKIILISNDWHLERVKYLFEKTFLINNIKSFEIIGVTNTKSDNELIETEKKKVIQLKKNPYGDWKAWLVKNYYDHKISINPVKKNDFDGNKIIQIRNENSEFFFNTNKFYWSSFKNIFYERYFSNEIPPFFIFYENEIIGFIGCKTVTKNINDIGIMFLKEHQNKGYGKIALRKFISLFRNNYKVEGRKIISKILKTNLASFKIFMYNGFVLDKNKSTNDYYYLFLE